MSETSFISGIRGINMENLLIILIVALAGVYVVRKFWRSSKKDKTCCCSCSNNNLACKAEKRDRTQSVWKPQKRGIRNKRGDIFTMKLIQLDDSLQDFIDIFNQNPDKPSFVALLSPT